MKKILIAFAVLLLSVWPVRAAVSGQADDATIIGGGARPLGMGRAFTAISDDVDGLFINPAGVAALKGPSVMTMFTNLLGEVYYYEYSGAVPAPFGTVGAGYITTGVNNVIPTDPTPSDYYDSLLLFSYSSPLSRFLRYGQGVFVGTNLKVFNRGITGLYNQYATGYSLDLGVKYIMSPYISFGLCRQNLLPVSMGGVIRYNSGAEEALASISKVGVAIKPVPWKSDVLLAFDADLPAQSGRPVTLHAGGEWKVVRSLTLRAGLDQSVDTATQSLTSWNPSFGLSLGYKGFRIDYAYHPYYNDAALATSYVSISYTAEPLYALKGGPAPLPDTGRRNTF